MHAYPEYSGNHAIVFLPPPQSFGIGNTMCDEGHKFCPCDAQSICHRCLQQRARLSLKAAASCRHPDAALLRATRAPPLGPLGPLPVQAAVLTWAPVSCSERRGAKKEHGEYSALVLWLPSELGGLQLIYRPGEVHKKLSGCGQSSRRHVRRRHVRRHHVTKANSVIWSPGNARCSLLAVVRSG